MRHYFEEVLVIHYRFNDVLDIVRHVRIVRNHTHQRFIGTTNIIRARLNRSIFHVVGWQEAQQFADTHQSLLFIVAQEMSDTTLAAVCISTTQFFLIHFFVCNGFHYIRTCNEHVTLFFHHENEVSQCRRITSTSCTRTQNS